MIIFRLIFATILCSTLLYAGSFELSSVKKDSYGNINESGLHVESEKKVIATGYGINKQQALDNAFKTAIEQYVGVVVDSETMMKNGKLIKDDILTASNGFLKSYKEISSDKSEGLIEVKIEAIVKSQKVFNKIKSLNISTITLNNSANIYARVSTKAKSKKDAEKILKKVVGDFFSNKSLQEMLSINITNAKVNEDKEKNGKVPVDISYTLAFNYKIYSQKIKQLEQVFKNLGAKLHKRVDLPHFSKYCFITKNISKVRHLTATDFGIIKKYGQGYKLDVWKFPKNWGDIYPFNGSKAIVLQENFQIIIEVKDNNSEVLFAGNITPRNKVSILKAWMFGDAYYNKRFKKEKAKIVNLAFDTVQYSRFIQRSSLKYKVSFPIAINNISKIKNITIELEEK